MQGKRFTTHACVPINPNVLHTTWDEASPAPEVMLVAHFHRYIGHQDRPSLREGRVRGGNKKFLAHSRVVLKLASYEVERPD